MQLELNRRSKVPMYRQLAAELREQIVSGAMAEGYRLPPERELSSRLEVNRTTVLQAYQQLKDEGLIASKVGKGTFVLPAASASRTSHTSNSDFGNAITRTTRSSAEMGTSQASSSGDVERATSTDFLTTDQGSSSAAVHTIRESRSVQGPEPTVVRPPWSVLFSDYSNRFTYHDIASAERAQRGDTIIDFATVRRTRRISRTICCARSASKHSNRGNSTANRNHLSRDSKSCVRCLPNICAHEAYNAASAT